MRYAPDFLNNLNQSQMNFKIGDTIKVIYQNGTTHSHTVGSECDFLECRDDDAMTCEVAGIRYSISYFDLRRIRRLQTDTGINQSQMKDKIGYTIDIDESDIAKAFKAATGEDAVKILFPAWEKPDEFLDMPREISYSGSTVFIGVGAAPAGFRGKCLVVHKSIVKRVDISEHEGYHVITFVKT